MILPLLQMMPKQTLPGLHTGVNHNDTGQMWLQEWVLMTKMWLQERTATLTCVCPWQQGWS